MVMNVFEPLCDQAPIIGDLETAHDVVQQHQDCNKDWCLQKRGALEVLIEAGHYIPSDKFDAVPADRGRR
jgi:hypothetical protein